MEIINKNLYKKMQLGILIIIISLLFIGCGDDNNEESFWNKEIYDNEDTQPQDVTDDVLGDRNGESGNVGGGKYVEEADNSTSNETQQMTDIVQNEAYHVAYRGYTLDNAPYAELIDNSPLIEYKDLLRYKDKYLEQWVIMNGCIEVHQNGMVGFNVIEDKKEIYPTYIRAAFLDCTNAEVIGDSQCVNLQENNEIDCLDGIDCTILGVLTEDANVTNTFGIAVLYFIF